MSDNFRTDLKGARRLGSAKSGTHHWWAQRVSAIALLPLSLWFAISVVMHVGSGYEVVASWVGFPVNAILLSLLLVATFYHMVLGLQVVIEDYVNCKAIKIGLLLGIKFVSFISVFGGLWAILKLAL